MQKFKVAAAIFGCVLALAALLVPAYAEDVTTSVETQSSPDLFGALFDPPVIGYYSYRTRSGAQWANDLPASPVTAPVKFVFYRGGNNSASDTETFITLYVGDTYYVDYNSNQGYWVLHYTRAGTSTSTNTSVRGYDTSDGIVYYAASDTVTTVAGDTLTGVPVYTSGGGIPVLSKTLFQFGDNLLAFVSSHWVVMIPLVIWLLVVAISAIKKIADPEG